MTPAKPGGPAQPLPFASRSKTASFSKTASSSEPSREQRVLGQIELDLAADEPNPVCAVSPIAPRGYLRLLRRSTLVFTLGLTVLIVAVIIDSPVAIIILGVLGFVVMTLSGLRALTDLRRRHEQAGLRQGDRPTRSSSPTNRRPAAERAQERWLRRADDQD